MTAQTILITGATAGIGRHAALHLAARGHRVVATGRNRAALAELAAADPRVTTVQLDVTDPASIDAAVSTIRDLTDGAGVDVLVNNAGYGHPGALIELPDEALRAQFETNVFGLMAVTRAFARSMQARGHGRIINVSSIGGRVTFPMFGAYHASKYAVEALSDALRLELVPFGVQVSIVEPGPIRTGFTNRSMKEIDRQRVQETAYAAAYARADRIAQRADAQSAGPEVVSRAIAHAVESRRPRRRYVVPFKMTVALLFLRAMPAALYDLVVRSVLGLSRKELAARTTLEQPAAS